MQNENYGDSANKELVDLTLGEKEQNGFQYIQNGKHRRETIELS